MWGPGEPSSPTKLCLYPHCASQVKMPLTSKQSVVKVSRAKLSKFAEKPIKPDSKSVKKTQFESEFNKEKCISNKTEKHYVRTF